MKGRIKRNAPLAISYLSKALEVNSLSVIIQFISSSNLNQFPNMDNLCFKVKGLQGKVETINISSSFTFNDLYALIANKFNIQDPESFVLLSV